MTLRERWRVVLELAGVAAIDIADRFGLLFVSEVPFLFAYAWLVMRLRGARWRNAGLVRPPSWPVALAAGAAAGVGMELLAVYVTEPTVARMTGRLPELSDFRPLVGNLKLTLLLLVPVAVLSALEEMFYRGFLMNRVADLTGRTRAGWMLSLIVVTTFFGWAHQETQGIAGFLQESLSGLLLGLTYLAAGRTLAIPVIAHIASNVLAFILIYLGRYPGV